MRSAPWQVRGIDPEAREAALVAAHSVGMSLGEWLSSVIHDKAAEQGVGQDDESQAQGDEGLAAITERLDDLSRQISRLQGHAPPRPAGDPASSRIADAILQLNGRLDQVITENRSASSALEKRVSSVDRALASLSQERLGVGYAGGEPPSAARSGPPSIPPGIPRSAPGNAATNVEDAVAEIAARQRALDGEFAAPPSAALQRPPFAPIQCRADEAFDGLRKDLAEIGRTISEAMPRRPDEDFAGLRRDLAEISRTITQAMPRRPDDEVAGLRKDLAEIGRTISEATPGRTDEAVAGLRKDLAEISRTLAEAMPRRAIEALEGEVRALVGKLDASPRGGADAPALAGLEQGLREVRDALRGLAPAESLVGFDAAVRSLSTKIDQVAAGGHDPAGLQQLEAAIASLRGVMDQVASSDALAALAQDVHALAGRLEYGAPDGVGADIISTLDARIGTIADAIEAVREQSLHAAQVVQAAQEAQAVQAAQVVQAAQAAQAQAAQASQDPHGTSRELDQLVKSLNDKLEHLQTARVDQLSRGEQLALGGLEDRIAKLVEKLDASEGRLGHLEAIERGMAELLVHLESLRANGASAALRPPPAEPSPVAAPAALSHDVAALRQAQANVERRTEDSLEVVHGAIETVVDRLATIESNIRADQPDDGPSAAPREPAPPVPPPIPPAMPAPPARPAAAASPPKPPPPPPPPARAAPAARAPAAARPSGDDHLPHDYPLEPGSGPPRVRPGAPGIALANAADRVAASEAPLRAARGAPGEKGAPSESDSKSGYLQAARRAAQYAAQNAQRGETAAPGDPDKVGSKLGQRLKAIFVGISVAVIIVVALRFAASYLQSADLGPPTDAPAVAQHSSPAPLIVAGPDPPAANADAPLVIAPPLDQPLPPVNSAVPADTAAKLPPLQGPSAGMFGDDQPSQTFQPLPPVAPAAASVPIASTASRDVTGSINTQTPQAAAAAPVTPAPAPAAAPVQAPAAVLAPPAASEALPAGIGGKVLIAAAAAGEPAAAFEIATRFAEGRGVPQDYHQAALWYARAAKAGLAPAMFRLGALYEKGNGVAKDLNEARRLYVAAAEKGNPNAMHNVGVLYAEGVDGKPDFKTAADWFRKSAMLGIADSQYNLAVLYARGIGVGQNLSEAYQWFALAAKSGDVDAAKKRDELAARLEPKTLAELRQKVDGWVAQQPPQEASVVPVPPGGWDKAEPAPAPKTKPTKHTRARAATAPI